jgi:hypothetical protein
MTFGTMTLRISTISVMIMSDLILVVAIMDIRVGVIVYVRTVGFFLCYFSSNKEK